MDVQEKLKTGWEQLSSEKFKKAIATFQEILAEDPNEPDALQFMGQIAYTFDNLLAAEDYFQKSLAQDANQYPIWVRLGNVCNKLRKHDQALKCFENAAKVRPNESDGYYQIGHSHLIMGDQEKGAEFLRKAVMLDDNTPQAFRMLANTAKLAETDEATVKCKEWLKRKDLTPVEKIHLNYGMAYVYEACGKDKKFFEHLETANATQHNEGHSWRDIYKINFDGIEESFSGEDFQECVAGKANKIVPVFIVGMPRSGSTLTEQIITCHPAVFPADEVDYMTKFVVNAITVMTKKPFLSGFRDLSKEHLYSLSSLYQDKLKALAPESEFITDKFLANFWTIGVIRKIMPWAKVINISRNPMDTALSVYRNHFLNVFPFASNLTDLGDFYVMYHNMMKFWDKITPGFVYSMNYEDLVGDPEQETRKLIEFCGLPWDDACLEPHKNKRRVMTLSQDQVRSPIYSSSIGKWKRFEKELEPFKLVLEKNGIVID